MTGLTLEQVKEAIADAQGRRPYRGHIRCSPATYSDVLTIALRVDEQEAAEGRWRPMPRALDPDSVALVIDADVPDGELQVKVPRC